MHFKKVNLSATNVAWYIDFLNFAVVIDAKVTMNFSCSSCEAAQCTVRVKYTLHSSLSPEAQEYFERLKKISMVVVQILMLYVSFNKQLEP